jgi:diguanylate cyclase (GGDEF)-like protein
MAASDIQISDLSSADGLPRAAVLVERVEEEIARAERHRTALSCLLVGVEDLRGIEQSHGRTLSEQVLAYVGLTLRREFRRYDRVGPTDENEYLVVLPGADGARGETVARRAMARLRAIKIEAQDVRRALSFTVGIATWREDQTAEDLIAEARTAAGRRTPEQQSSVSSSLPLAPLGLGSAVRI